MAVTDREHPTGDIVLSRRQLAAIAVLYIIGYVLLNAVAGVFEFWPGVSAWNPPPGLSLALLLLLGPAFTPLVFVAALIAGIWPGPVSSPAAYPALSALIVAVGYGGLAWAVRSADFDPLLSRLKDVIRLVVAALVGPIPVALAAVALPSYVGAGDSSYGMQVLGFWIGDVVGILSLAPALLIHGGPYVYGTRATVSREVDRVAQGWMIVLYAAAILASLWLAFGVGAFDGAPSLYVVFLPLAAIALAHGLSGASLAVLATGGGAAGAAMLVGPRPEWGPETSAFLVIAAAAGLLMGGLVTARRQAIGTLITRQRQLAAAERIAEFGSWSWHFETDECVWSPELYRIHGFEPGEIEVTPTTYLDRMLELDRRRARRIVDRCRETGQSFLYEHRTVRPDGSIRVLIARGGVETDVRGQPVAMAGTCHDITREELQELQLRHVEEHAKDQERYLRSIIDRVADVVVVVDASLNVRYVSAGAERALGRPPSDISGRPLGGLIAEEDRRAVTAELARATKQREDVRITAGLSGPGHDGRVELSARPLGAADGDRDVDGSLVVTIRGAPGAT